MSWLELATIALWSVMVGYGLGHARGLERGRQERRLSFQGKELQVTIEWSGIERLLAERGLIAVPEGADSSGRKEPAR
jgi:hypothetical protein